MSSALLERAVASAVKIRENAYAPFSGFKVGAALITGDGEIFNGVNVENSSFGATVCAERNAIFSAVTAGRRDFSTIVIASDLDGKAVYPCGICCQVMADFNPDMRIVLVNSGTGAVEQDCTLKDIFPQNFEFKGDKE